MNRKNLLFITLLFFSFASFCESNLEILKLKNSIPVYYIKAPEKKVCAVYIVVNGGVFNYTNDKSGIEKSLFEMMTLGSKSFPCEKLINRFYETQGEIIHYSMYSGSVLGLSCIDHYLDELLPYMLDGFVNPSYEEKQVNLFNMRLSQKIQKTLNDPVSLLMFNAKKEIYRNHVFETSVDVTPDSIGNITVEQMKAYHRELLKDSGRISVIAVGNISRKKLLNALEKYLSDIPEGERVEVVKDVPELLPLKGEPVILTHPESEGTGFGMRFFSSPSIMSEDYVPSRIAELVYDDILFNIVREKYGVCYTPQTSISSSIRPVGFDFLYRMSDVRTFTERLKEAENIMISGKVVSSVENGEIIYENLEDRIEGYINSYINRKYGNQKTTQGVASRLASSLLQFGDIYTADTFTEKARKVTAGKTIRVFKKYWMNDDYRWFVMTGPETAGEFRFSE